MMDEYDPITTEKIGVFSRFIDWVGGPLQFLAFLVTSCGTFLVAQLSQDLRFYGFCVYFMSNILWILWALKSKGRGGVLVTYLVNFTFNILGIINNYPWP